MRNEGKTKMTRKDAARIQRAACTSGDGTTPKHSFASRAQSAADKNEPQSSFFLSSTRVHSPSSEVARDQSICPCSCTLL